MSDPDKVKRRLVHQAEMDNWLDGLAKTRVLIAPREVSGVLLYRPIKECSEIVIGSTRPVLSVKEIFFPPTEQLMRIHKNGTDIEISETLPMDETIIFGVNPCDARGVRLLDALFLETEPVDQYYAQRRENSIIIGIACKEMGPSCFCTSVGGAPDDPTGMDIMFQTVEGGFLVEAFNNKGHTLIAEAGWIETVLGGGAPDHSKHLPVPERSEWLQHFNDDYWMKISERCLSCRACAYVCPTCRCFAVRDERLGPGEFERIRCWDSCAGENYRRIAGGHRPRAEKGERLRNRFFCKFVYYPGQVALGSTSACTGCGRCIDLCPAGVDISEVLMDLESLA
jgi:sulfhydrogenase subunit beta (sulfur reductase)